MKNIIGYALLLLGLQFGVSYAGSDTAISIQQSANGINYVNGGIGNEQQKEMYAVRQDFNLQLTFAVKGSGEFLADVDVNIEDASGKGILNASQMGPLFWVQLNPGKYWIKVTSGNQTQTKTVIINRHGIKVLYFYW